MCKICLDQVWIIGLDGALKRCPVCSTPRQLSLVEFDAALHAIRLGAMEITEDDDEHIEAVSDPADAGRRDGLRQHFAESPQGEVECVLTPN